MKRAGVIGWPVDHSLSPVLHGYWLENYGIDGTYEKIPAAPEDFKATIQRLRDEGYAGVNVTVPHKEAAFALANDKSIPALVTGAANLLTFEKNGRMEAHNTDGIGLAASLNDALQHESFLGKVIVVLGAGGAARGAAWALVKTGATVHVLNRSKDRADRLRDQIRGHIPGSLLFSGELNEWPERAKNARLVVNSTSAGMGNNPPLDIDLSALSEDAVVCDIVYHPLETQLLKDAKARGHKTIDGLGMLMHQAVPSFEAFFGVRPEVTPGLRAALVGALGQRA